MELEAIKSVVERHNGKTGGLLSILEEIQDRYGYVPSDAMKMVSAETGRSMVDIYGVVTFYKAFRLSPRGKHLITACLGTACHVRGGPAIVKELEAQLGIRVGETTPNREFTLETVNCLGACALGPIVVVDGHYFSTVNRKKVKQIIEKVRSGLDRTETAADQRFFPIEVNCSRCNHSLMDKSYLIDGYPSIRVTVSANGHHSWLRVSSLYGSHSVKSEFSLPEDEVCNIFCPHCHAEINSSSFCSECGAPMISLMVRRGGLLQVCSRHGCAGHMLDINGTAVDQ